MPRGILISLVVCTVLYIAVALVLTGIVHYTKLNVPAPIALGVDSTGLTWLRPIIKLGAIAGLSSTMLVMLLGQPRIFFSMSRDGLLPPVFGKIHPRFKTPYVTTILTGVVVALVAGLFPIATLTQLTSMGTLLAFVMVSLGVLDACAAPSRTLHRPFKTPWMPWVPLLGALICFAQMLGLPLTTWIRLVVWLGIGLVIYFAYGRAGGAAKLRDAGELRPRHAQHLVERRDALARRRERRRRGACACLWRSPCCAAPPIRGGAAPRGGARCP